jgi:hypothetical protein
MTLHFFDIYITHQLLEILIDHRFKQKNLDKLRHVWSMHGG